MMTYLHIMSSKSFSIAVVSCTFFSFRTYMYCAANTVQSIRMENCQELKYNCRKLTVETLNGISKLSGLLPNDDSYKIF